MRDNTKTLGKKDYVIARRLQWPRDIKTINAPKTLRIVKFTFVYCTVVRVVCRLQISV